MSDVQKDTKATDGILVASAKAIGAVAGAVAATVGVHGEAAPSVKKKVKVGKLLPKNKARLPRRQKKILQKKTAAAKGK